MPPGGGGIPIPGGAGGILIPGGGGISIPGGAGGRPIPGGVGTFDGKPLFIKLGGAIKPPLPGGGGIPEFMPGGGGIFYPGG